MEPLSNPFSGLTLHTEPAPISHEQLSSMIERKSTMHTIEAFTEVARV